MFDEQKVETDAKEAITITEKVFKVLAVARQDEPQLRSDLTTFVEAYQEAAPHLEKVASGKGFNLAEDAAAFRAIGVLTAAGKALAATIETVIAEGEAAEKLVQ